MVGGVVVFCLLVLACVMIRRGKTGGDDVKKEVNSAAHSLSSSCMAHGDVYSPLLSLVESCGSSRVTRV